LPSEHKSTNHSSIELLFGSEKGKKVTETLENVEEVYTPNIVLAELPENV